MNFTHTLRRMLWKVGLDAGVFTPDAQPVARRKHFLERLRVDTVLDVGANTGQFAQELRRDLNYRGRIISFEPLSQPFAVLNSNCWGDKNWEALNYALGDADEQRQINVAGNSESSSLLPMEAIHRESAPASAYIGQELIEVKRLDGVFEGLCADACELYLKVDTQGFEGAVLRGAQQSLASIDTVQLEMSLVPLYEGELLLHETCELMYDIGYHLISLEPNFAIADTGQLLQADGIFHRARDGGPGL